VTLLLLSALLALSGQQGRPTVVIDYDGRSPLPSGVVAPTARQERPSRPPILALPEGELKVFAANRRAMHFIAVDSVRRNGDQIQLRYYTVFHPSAPSGTRLIAHWITEARVDCGARTTQSLRLSAYDEAGDEVLWLPTDPAEPAQEGTLQGDLLQTVCRPDILSAHQSVDGWTEALPFARARLGG
jgi:hypothetical protein